MVGKGEKKRKACYGIRMVGAILSSHYVVEPKASSYAIALLALRLQTGTKPKWQMGRKGRSLCDGKGGRQSTGLRSYHLIGH